MSDQIMEYIWENWPEIRAFVPTEKCFVTDRYPRLADGICTHPQKADYSWVHSRGGELFTTGPTPPNNFFWLGIQIGGASEYLFLMWYRDRRRFHFYDSYVEFYGQSDASVELTRERLHLALLRWRFLKGDVVFSGPWDWFDVKANRFEMHPVESFPEDWEQPES